MYLKSLEIAGFKSFAKKTALDFGSSITAIVGPNGSGKSNTAEAFRFVLGEQSLKSMRGKRGEDLIWNGAGESGRSNRASVKINFDNSKREFNIDFDEVSIERVVYRDSVSEYLINGSQVRLKDIIELLAGAHIGSSGHHIISQGEADHILIANPRERHEMVEDALGLKIYQYKKRESERKLEKTLENMESVEGLRKEIAPHIKFLKKQVEKIEKTVLLKEDLKVHYKEYLRREKIYIDSEEVLLRNERKEPESRLKDLEKELAEAKRILSDSAGGDEERKKVVEIEAKISAVRKLSESLSRDGGRIQGEIGALERMILKRDAELKLTEIGSIPFHDVKKFGSEVTELTEEAEKNAEISKVREVLAKIKKLVLDFINFNETRGRKEVDEYKRQVQELTRQKNECEKKIKENKVTEELLYKEYAVIKDEVEKEKDQNRDAEKAVFRIMAEEKEIYGKLGYVKDKESRLQAVKDAFTREIHESASLIGREVADYAHSELKDSSGNSIGEETVRAEPREMQEERRKVIERLKIRIEDAGAGGGDDVMREYKDVSERDEFLAKELLDLDLSSKSLREIISELDRKLAVEFDIGIEKINAEFQKFFALMFGGGRASVKVVKEIKVKPSAVELSDSESIEEMPSDDADSSEEGLDIEINLPRKKIKGLEMLSGGERALTSIALLFAISQVNPPPFLILDETDAALDEANSKKYGDMIENLSKYSQLILITHNRETMSRAGILYGVTMGSDGMSRLLSIQLADAVAIAK